MLITKIEFKTKIVLKKYEFLNCMRTRSYSPKGHPDGRTNLKEIGKKDEQHLVVPTTQQTPKAETAHGS